MVTAMTYLRSVQIYFIGGLRKVGGSDRFASFETGMQRERRREE